MVDKIIDHFINILKRTNNYIEVIESILIYLGLSIMILLSFFQVCARNLFSFGFIWADDLLRHLVLWTGFIGASIATKQGKHINIDVFKRLLKGRFKNLADFIINLAGAVIGILLFYASWNLIEIERQFPDIVASLKIPVWYAELIFPIGFGLITLRFLFTSLSELLIFLNFKSEIIRGE